MASIKKTNCKQVFILLTSFIWGINFSGQASAQTVQTVNAQEFEKKLQSTKDYQLIDVRSPEEFKSGHLQSAVNINFYDSDFSAQLEKLDKEKTVLVYCRSGKRSAKAASQMNELGFKIIFDLQGGITEWINANKPVEVIK